ncbi:4Fe-4S dicluster domain-containing protein [Cellulosimicrobium marinum]|uniref:4Fe-4S dicluster domain-containing protein n=1 Tax=Cellulosimicrobium marinum TaxID=1638992 RepID=UPI001E449AA2|nr:ferredoxin family protein [Cellulosimicrobium marinum]MCB7135646.1 ferredoxin family protein [Cellulosimicrobium marinum]
MIEVIDPARCTSCDVCVRVCPTNVFDAVEGGLPVVARQSDCQTCFQCEAWCPADAIFVAPSRTPEPEGSPLRDAAALAERGFLGLYRARVGWRRGDDPGTTDTHDARDAPGAPDAGQTSEPAPDDLVPGTTPRRPA